MECQLGNPGLSLFGRVANDEMQLNDHGKTALAIWETLPTHYPGVEIDAFVVMPNHVHGIIVLVGKQFITPQVGVTKDTPTLGEIVRSYKARLTSAARRENDAMGISIWQRNYYEHIIRNYEELSLIRK